MKNNIIFGRRISLIATKWVRIKDDEVINSIFISLFI